jgi:hypothetical protein
MELIRNPTGYQTDKDYRLLFEQAQKQSIICLCHHEHDCIDVAHTIWGRNIMSVSARGNGYVCADNIDDFEEQCKECDLEWIAPNKCVNRT